MERDDRLDVAFVDLASGLSVLCRGTRRDRLAFAFTLMDTDGDGKLTRQELEALLCAFGKGRVDIGDVSRAVAAMLDTVQPAHRLIADGGCITHEQLLDTEECRLVYAWLDAFTTRLEGRMAQAGMMLETAPLAPEAPSVAPSMVLGSSQITYKGLPVGAVLLQEADGVLCLDGQHACQLHSRHILRMFRNEPLVEDSVGHARLEAMLATAGIGGYDPAGKRLVARLSEALIPDQSLRLPWATLACGLAMLCRRTRVERLELCMTFLDHDGDGKLTPGELVALLRAVSQGAEEAGETARLLLLEIPGGIPDRGMSFHDVSMRGAWHDVIYPWVDAFTTWTEHTLAGRGLTLEAPPLFSPGHSTKQPPLFSGNASPLVAPLEAPVVQTTTPLSPLPDQAPWGGAREAPSPLEAVITTAAEAAVVGAAAASSHNHGGGSLLGHGYAAVTMEGGYSDTDEEEDGAAPAPRAGTRPPSDLIAAPPPHAGLGYLQKVDPIMGYAFPLGNPPPPATDQPVYPASSVLSTPNLNGAWGGFADGKPFGAPPVFYENKKFRHPTAVAAQRASLEADSDEEFELAMLDASTRRIAAIMDPRFRNPHV